MKQKRRLGVAIICIVLTAQIACASSSVTGGSTSGTGSNGLPLSVTILDTIDPIAPEDDATPTPDKHLIGVHIVVENQSDAPQIITPYGITLVDSDGFVYDAEDTYSSRSQPYLIITDLLPGERADGWVFYSVKDGASPAKLKVNDALTGAVRGTVDFAASGSNPSWSLVNPPDGLPTLNQESTFKGYSMTVLQLVDPAPLYEFYEIARPKSRVVALEIVVRNNAGSEPLTVSPARLHLVDDHGFVYSSAFGATSLDEIPTVDLAAGESAQGYVSFEVPEGYAPSYVRFAPDWMNDSEGMAVVLK